jgi:hypothetical protein
MTIVTVVSVLFACMWVYKYRHNRHAFSRMKQESSCFHPVERGVEFGEAVRLPFLKGDEHWGADRSQLGKAHATP